MIIGGFEKTSLLDYPSKIAAVVFTCGCNFRCGYCHNPSLITEKSGIAEEVFFDFLQKRKGLLDAVVISGGEPCLQRDLYDFIKKIKEMGFLVKLDTNGTNPKLLERLISDSLIDYAAMDIKAPLSKYEKITGVRVDSSKILESISILKTFEKKYEFRTTVVKSMLSTDDFTEIGRLISGAETYYLQRFVPDVTLDKKFAFEKTYSNEEFDSIIKILKPFINNIFLR